MNKLQKALGSFLKSDDADKLAKILEEVIKTGRISYEEAKRIIDDAEDILIFRLWLEIISSYQSCQEW